MLQTKWVGLYDDRTIYHVATPALYQIMGRWYLFAQACGRPLDDDYIHGDWELWCFRCDHKVSTVPGCEEYGFPSRVSRSYCKDRISVSSGCCCCAHQAPADEPGRFVAEVEAVEL